MKQANHKLENNYNKSSHCCESSRAHNRFSNLGIRQRDWEPLDNLTLKASGIWLQIFHRTRKTESLAEHKQNIVHTRSQEKGAWLHKRLSQTCLWVPKSFWGGIDQQWPAVESEELTTTVLRGTDCWHKSFWRRCCIIPTIVWPQANHRAGTQPHPSVENWINDLLKLALTTRTRASFACSQSLPLRSFPKPHPHPPEGRQNENHNHRKLIKLITWITALSISMKLWAMPCRATQDRLVMVESSDKMWSSGEGNGKQLRHSFLENPLNSMKRQKYMTLKN